MDKYSVLYPSVEYYSAMGHCVVLLSPSLPPWKYRTDAHSAESAAGSQPFLGGGGIGRFLLLKQTSLSKIPSSWRCSPHPMPDQHGVGRSCHDLKLLWQAIQLQHSHWQVRILPSNHARTDGNGHLELPLGSAESGVGLPHSSFSFCSVLLPSSFESCSFQEASLINDLYANLHLSLGNLTYEKLR